MTVTLDQMRAYIATIPHLQGEDAAQFMGQPAMAFRAAAHAYAGANPMAHHTREITAGGWGGHAQLMDIFTSPGAAKARAGAWLVEARRNRALGFRGASVAAALASAAAHRRAAQRATA